MEHSELDPVAIDLQQLSEEFDSLGLPELNLGCSSTEFLQDLVYNSRKLIKIHKGVLEKHNDLELEHSQLNKDNESLKKKLLNCKDEIKDNEKKSKKLENAFFVINQDVTKIGHEVKNVTKDKETLKKMLKSKEDEHKHTVQRLEKEIHVLRERNRLEIGKYVSNDLTTAELIGKYKLKEDVYNDTIKKLQNNNQLLLEELVNLQTQVVENIDLKSTK